MKMALRWYGKDYDTIPLEYIRQIPDVKGVITTLFYKKPHEIWTKQEIKELKKEVQDNNLEIYGIESLNVSEDIKAATSLRDEHISNYIESLRNLAEENIKLICYNFMPLFDWTRTDLNRIVEDGSSVLAFDQSVIDNTDISSLFENMSLEKNGSVLPGWDEDKAQEIKQYIDIYKNMDNNQLFDNLHYFLKAIMPVCNEYDIKMAIHPDDPAWPIFGIPRIIINKENIERMLKETDDIHNGITLCTGSLYSNSNNDILDMIDTFKDRIHFVHIRNIRHLSEKHFEETAHLSSVGEIDIYRIMKALIRNNFQGIIRPDHGRMIFGENAMPGYGLYDRALAVSYLNGLKEAIIKEQYED